MKHVLREMGAVPVTLLGVLSLANAADKPPTTAPGILPSGFGESTDQAVGQLRAATAPFRSAKAAVAAGYGATTSCVENPSQGGMGLHYDNLALRDATLDVQKPETLVYELLPDGSVKLNGVEFIVPIAAWNKDEAPTIMGQKLKRSDSLGFWYLHVWNWGANPSGLFADWNPLVKCRKTEKAPAGEHSHEPPPAAK